MLVWLSPSLGFNRRVIRRSAPCIVNRYTLRSPYTIVLQIAECNNNRAVTSLILGAIVSHAPSLFIFHYPIWSY